MDMNQNNQLGNQYPSLEDSFEKEQIKSNNDFSQEQDQDVNVMMEQKPFKKKFESAVVLDEIINKQYLQVSTYYFQIQVTLFGKDVKEIVERRYSDFEWLYNQLKFMYPGYIVPPKPEKDLQTKFNYGGIFGDKKSENPEDLDTNKLRRAFFQIFLNVVINHKVLSQSKDLDAFLLEPRSALERWQKDSEYTQSQESYVDIVYKNFKWVSNKIGFGKTNNENYLNDDPDIQEDDQFEENNLASEEEFKKYQSLFELQKNKINNVFNTFQALFEYMKKSGENLGEAKSIFENLNKLNQEDQGLESFDDGNEIGNNQYDDKEEENKDQEDYFKDLIQSCSKGHELQLENHKKLYLEIQLPLRGYVEYYEECLNVIKERQTLINDINQLKDELKLQGDQETKKKIQFKRARLQQLVKNFRQEKDQFNSGVERKVEELIRKFSENQQVFSQNLIEIWTNQKN